MQNFCVEFYEVNYLYIAIVLLRLRIHYSVEIKNYKSQIRIRIVQYENGVLFCGLLS